MKKPYINKPVPDMYRFHYLDCNWKSANSISTALVDCLKNNPSVMDLMKAPSLNPLSLHLKTKLMCCAFARGVRSNHIVTMPIRNI